jgi:hypothetical protein
MQRHFNAMQSEQGCQFPLARSRDSQLLDTKALSAVPVRWDLADYFIWRVLAGGLATQTIVSSRPLASIEQSMSWALRMASEGVAPAAVAQCTIPLKLTHTSYLLRVCSMEEWRRIPTRSMDPTTMIKRI